MIKILLLNTNSYLFFNLIMKNKNHHVQDPEFRFEKWLMEFHPEEYVYLTTPTINTTESNYEGGEKKDSRTPKQVAKRLPSNIF